MLIAIAVYMFIFSCFSKYYTENCMWNKKLETNFRLFCWFVYLFSFVLFPLYLLMLIKFFFSLSFCTWLYLHDISHIHIWQYYTNNLALVLYSSMKFNSYSCCFYFFSLSLYFRFLFYFKFQLHVCHTQSPVTLCNLGVGATFGESILHDLPRDSTVVTKTTCELLRVEQQDFRLIWEVSVCCCFYYTI